MKFLVLSAAVNTARVKFQGCLERARRLEEARQILVTNCLGRRMFPATLLFPFHQPSCPTGQCMQRLPSVFSSLTPLDPIEFTFHYLSASILIYAPPHHIYVHLTTYSPQHTPLSASYVSDDRNYSLQIKEFIYELQTLEITTYSSRLQEILIHLAIFYLSNIIHQICVSIISIIIINVVY